MLGVDSNDEKIMDNSPVEYGEKGMVCLRNRRLHQIKILSLKPFVKIWNMEYC